MNVLVLQFETMSAWSDFWQIENTPENREFYIKLWSELPNRPAPLRIIERRELVLFDSKAKAEPPQNRVFEKPDTWCVYDYRKTKA